MDEFNSSINDTVGYCSQTLGCFPPPAHQSNERARSLQFPSRAQRRLFSTPGKLSEEGLSHRGGERHIENGPTIFRNRFNGQIWVPVEEEPIQNHGNQTEGSCLRSHVEGTYCDGCEPSWSPSNFNFEGATHINSVGHRNDHHCIQLLETNQRKPRSFEGHTNDDDLIPIWEAEGSLRGHIVKDADGKHAHPELAKAPRVLEGPNEYSSLMGNYCDGRFFGASVWKPTALCDQQWRILEAISQRKSVFVTGSAGTGKTYLLDFAVRVLQRLYDWSGVFVTASTGIAACALQGRTLHSFAGVELGEKSAEILALTVKSNVDAAERWKSTKALIIDEISMIDGEFLDKLDYVARKIRESNEVFGGLQLVVTGDFFQLPPVKPPNADKEYAFEADCWNRCFDLQVELTKTFRQGDMEFIDMLNEIRRGNCSPKIAARLGNCRGPSSGTRDGIALTRLYPTKFDVSRHNDMELMALNREIIPFLARDYGTAKSLLHSGVAPKELYLCKGAQVMLVKNLHVERGLVNGARGVVVGFSHTGIGEDPDISPRGLWPVVKFACRSEKMVLGPATWNVCEHNEVVASRTQVPLILAWALSVHKCQGMTLDRVETNLSKAFDYGMVYVALSRVKNLDGLRLTGFDPCKIKAHPKVLAFYERFNEKRDDREGLWQSTPFQITRPV